MQRLTLLFFFSMFLFACSDPCDDVNCGANGTCDDGDCMCDEWYEGTNCEIETRTKFTGVWNSTSGCQLASTNTDPVWTISNAAEINAFILQSPDVLTNRIIEATLTTENQATITAFSVGTSNFSGTINFINETTMTMDLEFSDPTDSFNCNYAMNR